MHIYYTDGPPTIKMGDAGEFEQGVSRDIDDKLAKQILDKKTVCFKKGIKTKTAAAAVAPAPAGEEG